MTSSHRTASRYGVAVVLSMLIWMPAWSATTANLGEPSQVDNAARTMPNLASGRDHSDDFRTLLDQGVSSLAAGHNSLADDHLTRALAMAPNRPDVVTWAAAARLRLRQPERALAAFAGLREAAYDPACWQLIAAASRLLGDSDAAFDALRRSVAPTPGARAKRPATTSVTSPPVPPLSSVADDVLMPVLSAAFSALHERRFEDVLEQVAMLDPSEQGAVMWLAVAAAAELGLGRPQDARTRLQEAVEDDPAFGFAWATLAEIALAGGDVAEAERCFHAALAADPVDLRALMGMTRLARLAGDTAAERRWLAAAYRYHPGELRVLLGLAEVLLRSGQVPEAGKVLAGLDPVQAASPEALRLLGLQSLQAGDFDVAVANLSRLVSIRPESKEAWFQLARAQAARRDIDSARHSFGIAIGLDPEHALPLLRLALAALELRAGRFDEALALAEAVRQAYPNDARAYDLRAAVYAGLGDRPSRMAALETGYALQPTRQRLLGLVAVLDSQGDAARSDSLLIDWLAQHPEDRRLWLMLAPRLEAHGRPSKAVDAYAQALVDPALNADPAVLSAASTLYLKQRDPRALELAERAYHVAPTRPDVIGLFGWVSVAQGDRDAGMTLLMQAVRMAPDDPVLAAYLDAARSEVRPEDQVVSPIEGRIDRP